MLIRHGVVGIRSRRAGVSTSSGSCIAASLPGRSGRRSRPGRRPATRREPGGRQRDGCGDDDGLRTPEVDARHHVVAHAGLAQALCGIVDCRKDGVTGNGEDDGIRVEAAEPRPFTGRALEGASCACSMRLSATRTARAGCREVPDRQVNGARGPEHTRRSSDIRWANPCQPCGGSTYSGSGLPCRVSTLVDFRTYQRRFSPILQELSTVAVNYICLTCHSPTRLLLRHRSRLPN